MLSRTFEWRLSNYFNGLRSPVAKKM